MVRSYVRKMKKVLKFSEQVHWCLYFHICDVMQCVYCSDFQQKQTHGPTCGVWFRMKMTLISRFYWMNHFKRSQHLRILISLVNPLLNALLSESLSDRLTEPSTHHVRMGRSGQWRVCVESVSHLQEDFVDSGHIVCHSAEDETTHSRRDPDTHEQNLFVSVLSEALLYMLHLIVNTHTHTHTHTHTEWSMMHICIKITEYSLIVK